MLKMNNKLCFLLYILLTLLLITGCEEEADEDAIIGTWETSTFETFENVDCTGELESKICHSIIRNLMNSQQIDLFGQQV